MSDRYYRLTESWAAKADEKPPEFVRCSECGHEQTDMGRGVQCESCGHGPMPSPSSDETRRAASRPSVPENPNGC